MGKKGFKRLFKQNHEKKIAKFLTTQVLCLTFNNVLFQQISIPSHGRFFKLNPAPLRKFPFSVILSLKNLAFETPLPPGISINLPCGGYGYFVELHNINYIALVNDCPPRKKHAQPNGKNKIYVPENCTPPLPPPGPSPIRPGLICFWWTYFQGGLQ